MASNPFTADLGSPRDLEQRLKRVPPEDTARGYFFQSTLEQIRQTGNEEALRRCLAASGTGETTAFFRYPITSLLRLLYHAAWTLSGPEDFEETLRDLGRQVCRVFMKNPVGKSLLVVSARNPKLLVSALPATYRTGWEHGWVSLKWIRSKQCIASIHGSVIPPAYIEGILMEVFQSAGIVNPRIEGRQVGPIDTEYELSWD